MAELSPMMKQYFEIKEKHKEHIVFFRLGDFYEMFFDDAILASKELELTLTGRDCGQKERAPMCGVPFHSSEGYIARLIQKGYKVAICEQTQDPSAAKGLVTREVIRVVTPGTVIESSMLDDDKNNYIASIFISSSTTAGVCFADISTGIIHIASIENNNIQNAIINEISRFSPTEAIFNTKLLDCKQVTSHLKEKLCCSVELLQDELFENEVVDKTINEHFEDDCKCKKLYSDTNVKNAVSGLLHYLKETQKKGLQRLKTVDDYTCIQLMHISNVTRANLELTQTMRGKEKKGTLLWVLDKTLTAMGKRLLRNYIEQPLVSCIEINTRLNSVDMLFNNPLIRTEIREYLSSIFDIERLLTRIVYQSAMPREVFSLATTLQKIPSLKQIISELDCKEFKNLNNNIDNLQDVMQLITCAIDSEAPANLKDGGVILSSYNQEVAQLREIVHGGKSFLTKLETQLKEETGIPKLKIGYNKVFGYYIEVTQSYLDKVPPTFIRKQTLTNAERYITDDLKQLESKILGANERLVSLEKEIYEDILNKISKESQRIQQTATAIAQIDVFSSLAEVAVINKYVKPTVNTSDEIIIKEGRHPVVEKISKSNLFIPNDTQLDNNFNKMLIITGPNMAGKSTYMRQTALITLMAQIGSFVPATECTIGVVDSIFTRVGASDDLSAGQSTFMVEMIEVAEILSGATKNSLVILDEIGRGTSTFDGMSIARSVIEYMCDSKNLLGCKTMFATHYHELTSLEQDITGVKNYNIAVKKRGDDITFLRRIVRGPADDSYGIQVAKLAGLPDNVIKRAKVVLASLEASAPDLSNATRQLDFDFIEMQNQENISEDAIQSLKTLDVETLTPLEALNYLYNLKKIL